MASFTVDSKRARSLLALSSLAIGCGFLLFAATRNPQDIVSDLNGGKGLSYELVLDAFFAAVGVVTGPVNFYQALMLLRAPHAIEVADDGAMYFVGLLLRTRVFPEEVLSVARVSRSWHLFVSRDEKGTILIDDESGPNTIRLTYCRGHVDVPIFRRGEEFVLLLVSRNPNIEVVRKE